MDDQGRFELIMRPRWGALIDELAELLPKQLSSPFATARVVVASPATAKVVSQQLAARLGICAGVSFPTLTALEGELAERAGVSQDRSRWLGSPLEVAVLRAMEESPAALVQRALNTRPGQRYATAARFARVLRHYGQHAPRLVEDWLAGAEEELAPECAWQPEVLRRAVNWLEVDPAEFALAIADEAKADQNLTFLLAIDEVSAQEKALLDALAKGPGVIALMLDPPPAWLGLTEASQSEPGSAKWPLSVELHDSHDDSRQVEVLRDELVRAFAEDPTLEPRDVLILTPSPKRYAHLLEAAFCAQGHPAAQLRLHRISAEDQANPVLELLRQVLLLGEERATASQLSELLLMPAVAHRWGLQDEAKLRELILAAGIRWGLDANQRARFELGGVTQNTWLRGLDRLLIGLAAGNVDAGLGLTGAEAVAASEMTLVGTLAELVSRLRRIAALTQDRAAITQWVQLSREIIKDLVGLPPAEEHQLIHAHSKLARLGSDHAQDDTALTRYEFARLLTRDGPRARVAAGNGELQIVALGELVHVEHRVVAMIGLSDDVLPGPAAIPDAIELPNAPDPRARRLAQLLAHARAAQRLIIVRQGFSARTGREEAKPVTVDWLLRELGVSPQPVAHPAVGTSQAAFLGSSPSFDLGALAAVEARRQATNQPSATKRRRTAARLEPVPSPEAREVTLAQLARFLEDPAKAFLRSRGGITRYQDLDLVDELPFRVDGLTRWQVIEELLEALRRGEDLALVEHRIRNCELLPPKEIGRIGFQSAVKDAQRLWQRSSAARAAELVLRPVDLTVDLGSYGCVRLLDQVATYGTTSVLETASSGDSKLIRPWLDSLALNLSGCPGSAKLVRFARYPRKGEVETIEFSAPTDAKAALTAVLNAWVLGQARLLPIPPEPGIEYAKQFLGKFNPSSWRGQLGWGSVWSRLGDSWPLFYETDVAELVSDTLIDTDPNNGQSRAFPAWAVELYVPMLRSMR